MNAYHTYLSLPDDSAQQECFFDACAELMDDKIREKLHKTAIEDNKAFLCLYCHEHFNELGEEFVVN